MSPEEPFLETSSYSLDDQIKRDEVERAGHTAASEEKSTQVLVRKPKGKAIREENAVVCINPLTL